MSIQESEETVPEISEEEIALLLQHEELTPELQQLIQQYQEVTASKHQTSLQPVGSNCTIIFSFEQYDLLLLPAIILGYSEINTTAQVLILTPVTIDTIPCHNYFGNNKQCTNCHFSHGYTIPIDQILPYEALEEIQTDHLQYGKKVWCQNSGEDIWKLGNIIDQLHGPRWRVRLKGRSRKPIVTVDLEHIKPFQSLGEDDNSQDDEKEEWSESDSGREEHTDYEDTVFKGKSSQNWGRWQEHTTGFGAKMMKKMGYIEGKGLGLDRKGRVDPVEAHLSHQGANNRPGLGLKRRDKKSKVKKKDAVVPVEEEIPVNTTFDFMNSLLDTNKDMDDKKEKKEKKQKENSKEIQIEVTNKQQTNKTLAKLQSDLDNAQKDYIRAREAYRRNKGSPMEKQFSIKLTTASTQLEHSKKQYNQLSNRVKQEKQRKDMFTF